MLRETLQLIKISFLSLLLFTIVTGVFYPLLMAGIGHLAFQDKVNGQITPYGSPLIGQAFTDAKYFWSRPSATTPFANNAASSSGSNVAPTNPALLQAVQSRVAALHAADPNNKTLIPIDLVTASASGLDPDISPAAAEYQAGRIARMRGISLEAVNKLIAKNTLPRQFGFLGEPRVNVRQLNIDLDKLK